jgi:arsenate reductase
LLEKKAELELRDLGKEPLSEKELDALIGKRDYREFLNPRNELYRARKMKQKPPSRAEAIKLMARNPNLIRRPIVVGGKRMVIGYDAERLAELG